ncbi:MAG: poly-beta-1,6 N-acetyl-D-glucosamine export porin PgaA, partial [Burkholderiales bacterium]
MIPPQPIALIAAFLAAVSPLTALAENPPSPAPPPPNDSTSQQIQRLKDRSDRNPGNKGFLYDYLSALGEAGHDAELVALVPNIELATAPVPVLNRAGRAASNLKRFGLAVELYQAAIKQAPDRIDIVAGLAYSLIDDRRPDDAVALLEARKRSMWQEIPLLEAYAEALQARRDPVHALLVYERILALEPANRAAIRNRIFTVARIGAPHRAVELAQQSPGALSEDELLRLKSDQAALTTRWGAAADQSAPDRFDNTDIALADNERLLQELQASGKNGAAARRLQFDRIEALRNRVRMREAVALYESLDAEGVEVPPYAQVAAADAYLYLEQPEKARDLYLRALPQISDSFSTQVQLFYAYSDAEQHREALEQIDRVVAATPQRVAAYSPFTIADNPDYASATATAAAARGYQDYLDEAEQRLEDFRRLAPYNMEARDKLAAVYSARGWPSKAEQEQLWVLAAEPAYRDSRIGYANTLRELQDWAPAGREVDALEAAYPDDRQVQRAAREWRIHNMRELQIDAGTGDSSGGASPLGTKEHAFETRLYSQPIKQDWRAFLHQFEASATFPDGKGYRRRLGAGAEYRVRDLRLAAELSDSYDSDSDLGVSLTGSWSLDDHWNFDAATDSSSNDIPLEARLADVRGTSLRAGVTWRAHESRSFGASLQTLDFSDGNRRNIVTGAAFQRFVTGPVWKLDGAAALYASSNSASNVNYFNPEDDFGLDLTLIGEQRLWRRY